MTQTALAGEAGTALSGRRAWTMVWALAFGQLVSWGSLYYAFAVLVLPMEQELGWSKSELNGALSLGLLAAGLAALPVGAWIDRHGGRAVMTAGSLAAALLLLAWSQVVSIELFYLLYILMGVAMASVLYEPAFAVVTQHFGKDYRRAITALTLVGGFAGTVFVPLCQLIVELQGWREALLVLAACNLLYCAAVHFFLLPPGLPRAAQDVPPAASPEAGAARARGPLRRALATRAFWGLAVCFVAYNITFTTVTFHFFPLLAERAVDTATIVATFTIFGPMQVVGRIAIFALGRHMTARRAGAFVVLGLPASILILTLAPPHFAWLATFACIYGSANGIMTIVRGTVVPELIGSEGYGTINGALTMPALLAKSLAPLAAALIWQIAGGYDAVLWTIFAVSTLSALAFWFAASGRTG
ncbi:MAG: MFS transporter [Alphaproteobacteria bacterium]|nr:MFS transporter [Alphaproteobacteria bacterium]